MGFTDIANQSAFADTPKLAWGFYGHRLQLYRDTVPHAGFEILREFGNRMHHGSFVYTSNVDGQFQKAGFDNQRIVECHGSIHHLQCMAACSSDIWPADELVVDVDESLCMLRSELPLCPHCGRLARPNILMFHDWSYLSGRTDEQQYRLTRWLQNTERLVIIELGAGTAIPSARRKGESFGMSLIRINPTDADVSGAQAVGLQIGALDGLRLLKARLMKVV
jgi:NAD-dependent SIR2 family protein deacetylase